MTKEEIINFLNTNKISSALALQMILEFAESKGKSIEDQTKITKIVTGDTFLLSMALKNAKDYFINKFEINSITLNGEVLCYF